MRYGSKLAKMTALERPPSPVCIGMQILANSLQHPFTLESGSQILDRPELIADAVRGNGQALIESEVDCVRRVAGTSSALTGFCRPNWSPGRQDRPKMGVRMLALQIFAFLEPSFRINHQGSKTT